MRRPNTKTYIFGSLFLFCCAMLAMVLYYQWSLRPVDPTDTQKVRVVIVEGDSVATIAQKLKDADLIRSPHTFRIYSEITGTKGQLQAGGYAIGRDFSVSEIIDRMSTGRTDQIDITVIPGMTLEDLADPAVNGSLADQGFDPDELRIAFGELYDHPLFKDKPAGTTLEGYIYPETYRISASSSVQSLLKLSFDEFYETLLEGNYEQALAAKGLNLYQGITLASIIQKEVSNVADQKQVAQVFLKRLNEDIVLGSDVTFFYAAKLEDREPSVNDPSPYNTRRVKGLPPGPISNFNLSALDAVINPAPGDYLFFVAGDGDDAGKTFFARTEAEHNANIEAHCHELCQ